jgi:endo-1,4-beta-D-glucanase Y
MMDDQTIFNQAINFYKAFKDPSGLMAWRISDNNGTFYVSSGDNDNATDGDLDITLALFLAHYRWGSASINYLSLAQASAKALVNTCVNKTLYSLKLGDWATSDNSGLGLATRSSDFMLGHIKLFILADTQNSSIWKNVYNSIVALCLEFVPKYANNTGFICDFPVYQNNAWAQPGGQVLEKPEDRYYNWNACRLFMRLATDAFDGNPNAGITGIIQKSNSFIKSASGQNANKIYSGYQLNGTPLTSANSLAFQAPFMLSAAVSGDQTWLNTLYQYVLQASSQGYYADSIKLLCMTMITGNYITLIQK